MDAINIINAVVVMIGLPTILGAFLYIGRKLQTLDSLENSSGKIKHNVKVVSDYLTRHHSRFDPAELQAFSPFQLTSQGKDLIQKIGFENVFNSHKDTFFKCIDSESPKLKYDVESAAIKSIYALSQEEFMGFLKVFFYNNPTRNLENMAPTLGVYVRDKYLESHPEITQ